MIIRFNSKGFVLEYWIKRTRKNGYLMMGEWLFGLPGNWFWLVMCNSLSEVLQCYKKEMMF